MKVDNLQINEELVKYVLDTYNLSDKTRERLARTSLFRLRDNGITDFDEAYTYIDNLATGAELGHIRMRSLDEEVGETDRTLHEIIGSNSSDEGLRRLFGDLQNRKKLSGREIIQGLSFCLDKQDIEVLSALMGERKIEFDVSLEYLLDHAEEIGERVRQVAQRYERDGAILLPRRTIVQVSFNYFSAEFEEHRGKPLTDEEKAVIRAAYLNFDGNASRAARHLGYSPNTVINCCREGGLKIFNPGNRMGFRKREALLQAYLRYEGNATKTERELGVSIHTVLKHWKKAGFEIRRPSSNYNSLTNQEHIRVCREYEYTDGNASATARNLGYVVHTVLTHWRKEGLEIRSRGRIPNN